MRCRETDRFADDCSTVDVGAKGHSPPIFSISSLAMLGPLALRRSVTLYARFKR